MTATTEIVEYCIMMNPEYLEEDEVSYELQIRGKDSLMSNRESKLRELRKILKEESVSKRIEIDENIIIDVSEERLFCRGKIDEMATALGTPKFKNKYKIESRLIHLKYRAARNAQNVVQVSSKEDYKLFSEMLEEVKMLLKLHFPKKTKDKKPTNETEAESEAENAEKDDENIEELAKMIKTKLQGSLMDEILKKIAENQLEKKKKKKKKKKDTSESSSEESTSTEEESDSSIQSREKRRKNKTSKKEGLPVNKWKLTFWGEEDKGIPLNDFLRQVTFLMESEGISEKELLSKIHHLFAGRAKNWLLGAKTKFKSWKAFVNELKRVFLPSDFDHLCIAACQRTFQDQNESFAIYLADMERLFQSLSYVIGDQQKLSILKRNMKSSYKHTLALTDIQSVKELELYCGRLDAVDDSMGRNLADLGNMRQRRRTNIFSIEDQGIPKIEEKAEEVLKRNEKSEDCTAVQNLEFYFRSPYKKQVDYQRSQEREHLQNFQAQFNQPSTSSQSQNFQNNFESQNQQFPKSSFSGRNMKNETFSPNFENKSFPGPSQMFNSSSNFNRNFDGKPPQMFSHENQFSKMQNSNFNQSFNNGTPKLFSRYDQPLNMQQNSNGNNFRRQNYSSNNDNFRKSNNFSNNGYRNSQSNYSKGFNNSGNGQFHSNFQRNETKNNDQRRSNFQNNNVKSCWNCGGTGHNFRLCRAQQQIFCISCGEKDVFYKQCKNCNSGNE
jgi:Retrotransposon gag protein